MTTSNLPDIEFKTLVIRMLNKLKERIDEFSENLIKERANIKMEIESIKDQSGWKTTINEMKNTLRKSTSD